MRREKKILNLLKASAIQYDIKCREEIQRPQSVGELK